MKIQYLSDLHLEDKRNRIFLKENKLDVSGDVLVLAGDIEPLNDRSPQGLSFLKWASNNYQEVLIVPGNHEYRNLDILKLGYTWSLQIFPNVNYYQNKGVRIDNIDFIFSTLWSFVNPESLAFRKIPQNDCPNVLYGGFLFTPMGRNTEFNRSVDFIRNSVLNSAAEKKVVVTHYAPSFKATGGFHRWGSMGCPTGSNLDELISSIPLDAWMYGHAHNYKGAIINGTPVVSNAVGCVRRDRQRKGLPSINFDRAKYIEL